MALADVVKKEHSISSSYLSSLLSFGANSPASLFGVAAIGPSLLILTVALGHGTQGLSANSALLSVFSIVLLLKWRLKGFLGAVSLVFMSYVARVFFQAELRPMWELGFFLSQGIGVFVAHQCFEECMETYERESLSVADDFEKLKEIHATYTTEKAGECERLKTDLNQKNKIIVESLEEIASLKNVVAASSAQASSFAQKNKVLQEKVFESYKEMVALRAKKFPPSIDPKMLQELNTLRVDSFQQKKLIEQVLEVVRPLKVDSLKPVNEQTKPEHQVVVSEQKIEPAQREEVSSVVLTESPTQEEGAPVAKSGEETSEKELLVEKEKEKARVKKVYYEQLDLCNELKGNYSKDLSNEEAKKQYEDANTVLKAKKADLVAIEKELFSLKKELRDKGKLFS